ncbi:hypothetical protein [Hyalangium rubrum]|uniref:Lipoprotein n=1 Tax=Hyalangium rubrum TaxID=3103134 RepID=A0ABU5HK24_9BACT|nr:hypothetical protein [Hyalangium sp. s54d21]MDY7232435.1 hypothetical protein [Hyalangium sp. s54d21]
MRSTRGLRHGRWLGGVLLLLALAGCRNFDVEPPAACVEDGSCVDGTDGGGNDGGDGGSDGGGNDGGDGGSDGGTTLPDGGTTLPDGGTTLPDGGTTLPDGGTTPSDGGTTLPDGGTTLPDGGTTLPDGGTTLPDGGTTLPDGGTTLPDGGTTLPDGGTTLPDGGTTLPDGGTTLPDGGTTPSDGGSTLPDGGTTLPDAGTPPDDDGGTKLPDGGTSRDGGASGPDGGDSDPDAGFDGGLPSQDAGLDAGVDDAGIPGPVPIDGGITYDGGIIVDELPIGGCIEDLCLKDKYVLSPASDGFNGLWIFDPYDVYLAHTDGAQVVQFNNGFAPTPGLSTPPFRLHGTTPDNVWAIAPSESVSPLSRFDGQRWIPVPVPSTGPSIRPPALFVGQHSTWVAGSHGGALRWDGTSWTSEPPSGATRGTLRAFWSNTSEPLFGVGGTDTPVPFGAYWQRQANGTWTGPTVIHTAALPPPALSAIAGPSTEHLYAVGGQVVLRWTPSAWLFEALPETLPSDCWLSEAQDVWVNGDGSDVWVTFDTSCVLRKKQGIWSARRLPVPADFQARQVEGFSDVDGQTVDLWITGYQPTGPHAGAGAYHFNLSWP